MSVNADTFCDFLESGHLLAALPISRLHVDFDPVSFPRGIFVCPPGEFDIDSLNILANRGSNCPLPEAQSAATGIDEDVLACHPLVVFPCRFAWQQFNSDSHKNHLRFVRTLSQYVDSTFLDVARFYLCKLGLADTLPGRAGTLDSHRNFAAAVLYNPDARHARMIAGTAFTHSITAGLGLELERLPADDFPGDGETGKIASHGLSLYRNTLEAYDHTSRFVSAMTLLDFLADPLDYQNFKDVKKVIARYVTRDQAAYDRLLDWFFTVTARKDDVTGEILGYRTRIVHLGHQLEDCLDDDGIADLYSKLAAIIHAVLIHMIRNSELDWEDYLAVRTTLGPFASVSPT